METPHIRVDRQPPLAVMTMDRAQVLNALNLAALAQLDAAFAALRADADVRAILYTGAGQRAFAAGSDLAELATLNPRQGAAYAMRAQEIFRRIETLGKPVIACIAGFALGGGCELALACTFRLAAENAQLGMPGVKFGMMQSYGGTRRLPSLIGRSAALKLLLTGETIDAAEALRIGMVDEVVPADRLMDRGRELALMIARNAPIAVAETLQAVDEQLDWRTDKSMLREADRFGRLFATKDMTEGLRAFLEKRPPVWKGE